MSSYLLLVPHGVLPSDHDLAAGLSLQLFGGEAAWPQDPSHKVELHTREERKRLRGAFRRHTHTLKNNYAIG